MVDKAKREPLRHIDIRIAAKDYRREWLVKMAEDDGIPPQALVRQLIVDEWKRRQQKNVVQGDT